MQIPRCRNILIARNSFFPSSHFAYFHSTPASLAKWKNKWNSDSDTERGQQQPSKNYIRYATRQKRADAKRALKDLLFKSGSRKMPVQDDETIWGTHEASNENSEQENGSHGSTKQSRSKKASRRSSHAGRSPYFGSKRKPKMESFDDFQATFGGRCYTWSFRSWEDSHYQSSTAGFEWRDHNPYWTKNRRKVWDTEAEDDNDEPCVVGSHSDRTILGLPLTGPLKMEDVKSAFRLSALKWHPDKHQGPSQAMAEEKFKVCVDTYKSLCNTLSSTKATALNHQNPL